MHIGIFDRRTALLPTDSLQALDWLNFFLAALLMGFGPFITVYLAGRGWVAESIGFVLTASSFAGLLTQVSAASLSTRSKPSGRSSELQPLPSSS